MRTLARETLFKILFSAQFGGGVDGEFKNSLYESEKLTKDDISYCEKILALFDEHKQELLDEIDKHSTFFPQKRIFPADNSILILSLCEILYCDDIPEKVSMNEAANIASKYSSAKSASFITGILSAVSQERKNV